MSDTEQGAPRLLVIGASDQFAAQCARAAAKLGAEVERADVVHAAARAEALGPHVLVVPDHVLAGCPALLEGLAERLRAALAVVDVHAIDPGELEILLEATLSAAEERRRWPSEPEGERGGVAM